MLPDRKRAGSGWIPPLPLILAVWRDTPAMLKMLRLTEHIEWAAQHDALDTVDSFLRKLREEDGTTLANEGKQSQEGSSAQ